MKGEFRERDHHEGNVAEYRELRPSKSARPSFAGINELSGSDTIVAEPGSTGVNFKRSFSTVSAPKKQASFGGKLFKILPVGFGRSESTIKKSN